MLKHLLKFSKSFCSILLIIVFLFYGCATDTTSEVTSNSKDDGVEIKYPIESPNNFEDGFACIELERGFASVDKDGNLLYLSCRHDNCNKCEDRDVEQYIYSQNKYHYFRGDDGMGGEVITTVKYDGSEIYRLHFPLSDTIISCETRIVDGMILAKRVVGDFESTNFQVALFDKMGKFIVDWSNIDEFEDIPVEYMDNINKVDFDCYVGDFTFCEYLFDEHKYVLMNILDKKCYPIDINSKAMDILHSYSNGVMLVDDREHKKVFTVSKTGEVTLKDNINSIYLNIVDENFIYYSKDNCFYDFKFEKKTEIKASNISYCSDFINDKALIVLEGDGGRNYFTLLDKNGNTLFTPILHSGYENEDTPNIYWDGINIAKLDAPQKYLNTDFSTSYMDTRYEVVCFYDESGNKTKDVVVADTFDYPTNLLNGNNDQFYGGMLLVRITVNKDSRFCYLKPDGTVLFPDGNITEIVYFEDA